MKDRRYSHLVYLFGTLASLIVYLISKVASLAVLAFVVISLGLMGLQNIQHKKDVGNTPAEIESILMLFANELKQGLSPERAFERASKNYSYSGEGYLRKIKEKIHSGVPLSDALKLEHEPQVGYRELLLLVSTIIEKDSMKAGREITQIVLRLRENRRLIEEEQRTRKAMSFKVNVLAVTCSISLSIITAMLPIFSIFTQMLYWPFSSTPIKYEVNLPIAFILALTSAISAYYAAKAILADKPYGYVIVSQISFWLALLAASTFLAIMF